MKEQKPSIVAVFGTRPEAIKMGPLLQLLQKQYGNVRIVLTGQHLELAEPVLASFGLRADVNLALMEEGQTPHGFLAKELSALPVYLDARDDLCMVHGDTVSALGGALCASLAGIPVAHIEAGLRSGNRSEPFPEELNRILIDAISTYCFAPTHEAVRHLRREGINRRSIFRVGNTGIDALFAALSADFSHPLLTRSEGKKLVLLTAHRREMGAFERRRLFASLRAVAENRNDVCLAVSVHPSAAVREPAHRVFDGCKHCVLLDPPDYPIWQNLLARAALLLTDSGGVQEEATALGIRTLVLRRCTERKEGVRAGVLQLVGTDPQTVAKAFSRALDRIGHDFPPRRVRLFTAAGTPPNGLPPYLRKFGGKIPSKNRKNGQFFCRRNVSGGDKRIPQWVLTNH